MTMQGHFRTDRGPGKGAYSACGTGAKIKFFNRGATGLLKGMVLCLDVFAEDAGGATQGYEEGGNPSNSEYPNDSAMRNCIAVTNGTPPARQGEHMGIFVLVTDLLGNGGGVDTEFEGIFEGYQVDMLYDDSAGTVVLGLEGSVVIMDISASADIRAPFIDTAAGENEKIIAIPQEVVATDGATTGKVWFSGDLGWGYAAAAEA